MDEETDYGMFGGDESATPPEDAGSEEKAPESVDEESETGSEILVMKNKLPSGIKEGDVCSFKVVKDFGDEVSLEYVDEGEDSGTSPESEVGDEIAALDKGGEY